MSKSYLLNRRQRDISLIAAGIIILLVITSFSTRNNTGTSKTGTLRINFTNSVNGKPVVLRDSIYSNYFGEQYSISKLKYYISNITLTDEKGSKNWGGYYLMNAASGDSSFEFNLQPGQYKNLEFLLGVDSIKNCSGAQTGALDPMNDMFWTWNSGYVMFKLEGTSPASTSDLQRIEYHIGGYKGSNNVSTKINFDFRDPALLDIKTNSVTEILIETNLDHYWYGNADIKIAASPVCTTTGELAKTIASNFKSLFSIKNISLSH